jgi:hypothetical protein
MLCKEVYVTWTAKQSTNNNNDDNNNDTILCLHTHTHTHTHIFTIICDVVCAETLKSFSVQRHETLS